MFKFVEYWAIFVKWFAIYLLTRKEKKRAVTLKQYTSSFEIGISKFRLNDCRYLWVSVIEAENILGQEARRWFSIRYEKKCFANAGTAIRKNWFSFICSINGCFIILSFIRRSMEAFCWLKFLFIDYQETTDVGGLKANFAP